MAKVDIKSKKLVWKGKYDDEGKLVPLEKPGPYPFQIVEVMNTPKRHCKSLQKAAGKVESLSYL